MDSILVIDDESDLLMLVSEILSSAGYKVHTATTKDQAMRSLKKLVIDLVLVDVCLSEGSQEGLEILSYCTENLSYLPVIMMSGHGNINLAVDAMKSGAVDFVEKPFSKHRLLSTVSKEIKYNEFKKAYSRLQEREEKKEFICESRSMQAMLEKVSKVIQNNTRVMLIGESGSGCSTIAEYMHVNSDRKQSRFAQLDCSKIKTKGELLGKLVGTNNANNGLLYTCLHGTLVLDKIDKTNEEVQSTLSQLFSQLNNANIDLKIISIASEKIEESVKNGLFSKDLFFRLSTVHIEVPSLRDRIDDILPLIKVFAYPYDPHVSDDVLKILYGHEWKGNLHELKNTVERMLIMNSEKLLIESLSWNVCSLEEPAWLHKKHKEAMQEFEIRYCQAHLRLAGGNQTIAAKNAGVDRSTFYRKTRGKITKVFE